MANGQKFSPTLQKHHTWGISGFIFGAVIGAVIGITIYYFVTRNKKDVSAIKNLMSTNQNVSVYPDGTIVANSAVQGITDVPLYTTVPAGTSATVVYKGTAVGSDTSQSSACMISNDGQISTARAGGTISGVPPGSIVTSGTVSVKVAGDSLDSNTTATTTTTQSN